MLPSVDPVVKPTKPRTPGALKGRIWIGPDADLDLTDEFDDV